MAQLFRSTARAAAVCQKITAPSANAAVNSFSHKKISTTNVSYLDTSDSVVDQRMDAGDNRWWKRAYFQMQGYYEYGLYHDDILQEDLRPEAREDDEVCEAVRRLPPDLQDERSFRICRAMNLSANKQILPKSEWVTFAEDSTKGMYLQPYLELIRKERAEMAAWKAKVEG